MKKNLFFVALAALALASCSDDTFVGENSPNLGSANGDGGIHFGFDMQNATRADIYGASAAELLGGNFYVEGTKGSEETSSPSTTVVFDNYLVNHAMNTAGTTASNTANWEYVGLNPGTAPVAVAGFPKLSSITGAQTIKYWDYSTDQYDFIAFSTGKKTPVTTTPTTGQVGVTKIATGTALSTTAYTFTIPDEAALKDVYITDIVNVKKANYGNEVVLRFKSLGAKVRLALYEKVPGYSVSDVKFYQVDAAEAPADLKTATKTTESYLISTASIPMSGTIKVLYPHIGSSNSSEADYNKASTDVTPGVTTDTKHGFGELTANYTIAENAEAAGAYYLGRDIKNATYAGSKAAEYYTTVFPVSSSNALTLRVDYKLTATDGSGETIQVYGARASVPAKYTTWLPNYAYTYIFKISDATNGWTTTDATTENQGLYPITFDAVVAEATDATAEQRTVTTVYTPSITTYQQGHDKNANEYSLTTGKDIYVRVMNTSTSPATLQTGLSAENSLLYELSEDATEGKVLDALLMRKTAVGTASTADVTGRNNLGLTNVSTAQIDNTVTQIVNGADDNPISVSSGTAGKIKISGLTADKSYAYVYVVTPNTKEVNQFEPVSVTGSSPISGSSADKFYKLSTTTIAAGTELAAAEAPAEGYLYFSVTKNGTGTTTYSYISPIGKATIPAGCMKVAATIGTNLTEVTGDQNAEDGNFYFDKFITNNGEYAVKVIKIVA